MKIITNVARDGMGGIQTANRGLFKALDPHTDTVIALEIALQRRMRAAVAFRDYSPEFFHHHTVSAFDAMNEIFKRATSLRFIEKEWEPVIEEMRAGLREESPDVALLSGTYIVPWAMSIACEREKIPIVLRYAGVLTRETENAKPKLKRIFRQMEQSIANRADSFISPSRLCQDVVEKEVLKRSINNATVIPNPVHVPTEFRSKKVSTIDPSTIAAVGRWTHIKNFNAYFRLHQHLRREQWPHQAYFITNYERAKRVPRSMTRVAPMHYEQLLNFYSTLGLLIIPSYFETFCNVAAEAILSGSPVLVSEQVGFAEYLKAAGLENMVIKDFRNTRLAAERAKELCGTPIPEKSMATLRSMLNPESVRDQILAVLRETASL